MVCPLPQQRRGARSRLQHPCTKSRAMPGQRGQGKGRGGCRKERMAATGSPVVMGVQRGHHSTAQPRISLEKQK